MKSKIVFSLLAVVALSSAMAQTDDSKSSMKNMEGMKDIKKMENMKQSDTNSIHKGVGVVVSIDSENNKVVLKHEPIQSMNWPTMTMGFKVKDNAMLKGLSEGKSVDFEFGQEEKDYVISSITLK